MSELRFKVGPDFTLICPVCGGVVSDATAHISWHRALAQLVLALNEIGKPKTDRRGRLVDQ